MSEARSDVLERGLLIGGSSVTASSGKLADDVCPWDGEIYARVAAGTPADITRAADAAQAGQGAGELEAVHLRTGPGSRGARAGHGACDGHLLCLP